MKKNFLILLLCCAFLLGNIYTANAQKTTIKKGSILLGAGVAYPPNGSGFFGSSNFAPVFEGGYALKNNLVLGLRGSYTSLARSGTAPYSSLNSTYNMNAGIFLRKYVPVGKHFAFYGEGSLEYTRVQSNAGFKFDGTNDWYGNFRSRGISLGAGMGATWASKTSWLWVGGAHKTRLQTK
jgi:hypothetical protein